MKGVTKLLTVVLTASMVLPFMQGIPVFAAGGIKIDAAHFPDDNFRAVIAGPNYDADQNGYLSDMERSRVMNIHCENSNIRSLKGIEYFGELQGLWCLNNHISSWDLSGNPHLKGIWCSKNDFTSLDFSDNPELEWVYCFNCKLTSLNMTNNPEMAYVECNANPNLTKLDVSKNGKLENLFCSDCGLRSLDLSHNPLLCELDAFNNKLTSIDLSNNKNLKRLDIWNNPNLGNVDVSMLPGLEFYNCAETGATRVDMSKNPELQMLVCSYNEYLTYLDISKNPKLSQLHLDCDWRLTSLDMSHNPKLYYLQAFGLRGISKLNISNNPHLIKAYKEGVYADEPHLGEVHSYTLNYGGSGEYFDNLLHCLVVDNDVKIVTTGGQTSNVHDSIINTNDGHSDSEQFATREEAIQILYIKAGSPAVSGKSRFTDVPADAPYAKAVKWGEDNNICFGYPDISSNTFGVGQLISRQDFALMAHRMAGYLGLGTAFDYGRTDWFDDFKDIDFYAWGAFTWSVQWEVIKTKGNKCYPHGRLTKNELKAGVIQIFNLDEGATYSSRVDGNGTGGTAEKPDLYITSQPKNYTGPVGSTASFSVTAQGSGMSYQWQVYTNGTWKNSNAASAKTSKLSFNISSDHNGKNYRCMIKDKFGKTIVSNAATVYVGTPLAITKQPANFTGSAGNTASFSVTAQGEGLTYQWQVYSNGTWANSGATGAKTSKISFTLSNNHNGKKYRCVIKDKSGRSVTSNAATVTVVSPLTISKQPSNYAGALGSTASFSVTAQGSGLSYQWQVYSNGSWSNSGATGAKTSKISFKVTNTHNGMKYRCIVKDKTGKTVTTNTVSVRIVSAPSITKQPVNYSGLPGSTASFSVTAQGTGLAYQWQVYSNGSWSNSGATGAKTSKISFKVTNNHNGMKYRCIIKDSYGQKVISNTVSVRIM
ncbi:MAG: hypothetical protein IKE92_06785 [Clostridiales bacterium]|nr:hypothetical protein [Clostridiales bacterium]